MSRNIILVDPLPRTLDLIMTPDVRRRLEQLEMSSSPKIGKCRLTRWKPYCRIRC